MAERIFGGRCEDCYNKDASLEFHDGILVPEGESGKFCNQCMAMRHADAAAAREPRPVGLYVEAADSSWVSFPDIAITVYPDQHIKAQVRCLQTKDGGSIRLQFAGQTQWLAGGLLWSGLSRPHVLAEIKGMLRRFYFTGPESQDLTVEWAA